MCIRDRAGTCKQKAKARTESFFDGEISSLKSELTTLRTELIRKRRLSGVAKNSMRSLDRTNKDSEKLKDGLQTGGGERNKNSVRRLCRDKKVSSMRFSVDKENQILSISRMRQYMLHNT
eukprot:TRINITY_DN10448_c0_g1_i3.p2 TRINITY_DN10448_c0_g1~~TRINITY_DN10448_c0_g1_i3.p2  ORF type:complete len:120 (-),score=20.86 TRINITY_DN10448_c0_g1_i3:161-520(-)